MTSTNSFKLKRNQFIWLLVLPSGLALITFLSSAFGSILILFVLFFLVINLFRPIKRLGLTSRKFALVVLLVCFFIPVFFIEDSNDQRLALLKVEAPQQYLQEIQTDNPKLWLKEVRKIDPDEYLKAIRLDDEFLWLKELKELKPEQYQSKKMEFDQLQQKLELERVQQEKEAELQKEINRAKKIERLVAKAKKIPATEHYKNLRAYKELLLLDSKNTLFEDKVVFYTGEIAKTKAYNKLCGENKNIEAWVMAKGRVKAHLKAPRTAKFGSYSKSNVTRYKGCKYTVRGYVDSQNGFGAMLRSEYYVVWKRTTTGWELEDIEINSY